MLLAVPTRWDEACFAVPAVRALITTGLPGAIVCHEQQSDFWEGVTDLPLILFSEKTKVAHLRQAIGDDWEASLAWEDGIAATAFAKARIPRRLGCGDAIPKKRLTHPIDLAEKPNEHRVRRYLNACEQLGIDVVRSEFFAPVAPGAEVAENAVLLCPGSDFGPSHEWPLDRWFAVAEALLEKGKRLTVAGGVGGRGLGRDLAQQLGERVEFFESSPLAESLPMLAGQALVIAADGSLPHLAAHAGSTCVTLFGPNDAVWKRPLGKRHVVVKKHVECAPCLSPKCLLDGRCQSELDVSRVLAAVPV